MIMSINKMTKKLLSHDSNTTLFISCILHALILFTILSGLLLFIISVLAEKTFKSNISAMIDSKLPDMLKKQDEIIKKNLPTDKLTVNRLIDIAFPESVSKDNRLDLKLPESLREDNMLDLKLPESVSEDDRLDVKIPLKLDTNKLTLKNTLKKLPLDRLVKLYSKPNEVIKKSNQNLVNMMIFTIVSFIIIFIGVCLILYFSCGLKTPITFLIIENLIIFLFIGAFEGYFFFTVGIKYIPVPPSFMINRIYDNIKSL